jgi:redox-sensitive bicupin YhaK (pirin superfamily)
VKRTIDRVFKGAPQHWVGDGFHVSNYFPSATESQKRMSPFFLLDYQKPEAYTPTSRRRGVGTHPHRGFETVTIAYEGAIAHRDSAGNGGIIGPGEVQWMTAGGGVLHNEFHDEAFARKGGILHMIQIWVNLPRKDKLTAPRYQALTEESIRSVALAEDKGIVRVISGAYEDQGGPAETFSPAHMLDLRLRPGAQVRLPTPKDYNTALLVLGGQVTANGSKLFKNDGDEVVVDSPAESIVLFLSGAPIDEPLVHYGPFVMTSIDEINEAIDDFNSGKFGHIAN